ncbi:GTPase HflX [Collinsella sp. AGMB00827]|uniref:GTPase HflX n=1 Tax=Collinsella ureilytica TaxID=2869515 RepID=A0ABS7MLM5_9ACTN|nr:GTPase HflX [Collinsella urealyticum]MBY4797995.1 GTPase HflX [Collinsella urealyticum]
MARFHVHETTIPTERAFLVGVDTAISSWPLDRSLDELERLADTAGAEVVGRMVQRLDHPRARTYLGSGKVEELSQLVRSLSIDTVIFDDELSPSQQNHLERALGQHVKVIDRTALILDIFGQHAKTKEGRLQVELAQLQYLLPRLRGMWAHLVREQTRGGIGSRFGQGETQLEIDRRLIRSRIARLKRRLRDLEERRDVQAKSRLASSVFRVALAGYTNAGKSTLLNRLTGSEVYVQDQLFATLDPTTRAFILPGGRHMTLTDTVGFIQKLPHGLVEAFKSTLSEVRSADVILKVADASDPDLVRHIKAVEDVLTEIGAGERPALLVLNKIDLVDQLDRQDLTHTYPHAILFSATEGWGVQELCDRLAVEAARGDKLVSVTLPYAASALLATLHEQATILEEEFRADGVHLVVKVPTALAAELERHQNS